MLKFYFSFNGRASRSDIWLKMWLPMTAAYAVIIATSPGAAAGNQGASLVMLLAALLIVVGIIPSIAVCVKRLHDLDMSGWWLLVSLVPLVGSFFMFIVPGCMPGTRGPNRFGEDPRGLEPWNEAGHSTA